MTQIERLTRVEVELKNLKASFEAQKIHSDGQFEELNAKLDDLLALRNKGVGVFWLASLLVGTGVVGVFMQLINWMKS